MASRFLDPCGDRVSSTQLAVPKARDLARLLENDCIDYAQLVECRACNDCEVVVFDVEVELGQLRVHAIEARERIAAIFFVNDEQMPETLALRREFPQVPHLNLRVDELPRSLCLYDQPYSELKRQWTGPRFVERIRTWLALTAKGKLHADDQPLEPLLWGHVGHIVLPSDLPGQEDGISNQLVVSALSLKPGDCFLVADYERNGRKDRAGVSYVTLVLSSPPQTHGVIRSRPDNLEELATFTAAAGLDLLDGIRNRIKEAKESLESDKESEETLLGASLILLLRFPKTREAGAVVESSDVWAFLTAKTVREVGIEIGLWSEFHGALGLEPTPPPERTGQSVKLDLLNPLFNLSRRTAAILNDIDNRPVDSSITCVGAGALGSQLILNAARAGFGRWTILDHDRLFPHNLARHALPGYAVGIPKAIAVANVANSLTDDEDAFGACAVNVLDPGEQREKINEAMKDCDVILDMSASVSVVRHLSHEVVSDARRISLFVNPSGEDLVLLAEDRERAFPLDSLEMQYYRALIRNTDLSGHFLPVDARPRYGQSCRDITSRIPQDAMAIHAAIGSRALRRTLIADEPTIAVWRTDEELAVRKIIVNPASVSRFQAGEWTVVFDSEFVSGLHGLREAKLPNETGGVIIGAFDLEHRMVYLVDTVPSPPDSDEWPTLYIRGSRGLERHVEQIVTATDGALHYVGEWHSHPAGESTAPSVDDLKVFAWLSEVMDGDGLPAVMMIVGDVGRVSFFLGTMSQSENLIPVSEP